MELEEFETALKENAHRLVLVDFNASWCGPCLGIKPIVMKLAEDYRDDMVLLDVDVDESEDIAIKYSIKSMPTFLFIKNGQVVDKLTSAQPKELERLVKKHAKPETVPFQGQSGKIEETSTFARKFGRIFNPLLQLGFERNKCILAAIENDSSDVETAVNWLMDHESKLTEADLKYAENFGKQHNLNLEAIEEVAEAKSLKCTECGKLLRNGEEAMRHSQRTKHTQFDESTEEYVEKILTAEEKQEMKNKIYQKMKEVRLKKEEQREKEERAAEKKRREDAKMFNRMRENKEKDERELHIARIKKEHEDSKLQKQAALAKIAADKKFRHDQSRQWTEPKSVVPKKENVEKKKKMVLEDELLFKITFPDGSAKLPKFNAQQSFKEVKKWAIDNSDILGEGDNLAFSTVQPKHEFLEEEMEKTLRELNLMDRSHIRIQHRK